MGDVSASRVVHRLLGTLGLELRRKRPVAPVRVERRSLRGALEHARSTGLSPRTVIDVGVAYGTPELYETFPAARHLLVEPVETFRPHLDAIVRAYPTAEYVIAAAAGKPGTVTLNVHPDLVGSSMYLEVEDSPGLNGAPCTVPAVTLDLLCEERAANGPYLLKIDVQGGELDALSGASRTLDETEYAIVETSLFGFFENSVQILDVITFMHARGFALYDIADPNYRPLDGALAQVDVAFVKAHGPLRARSGYATAAQRATLTRHLLGVT